MINPRPTGGLAPLPRFFISAKLIKPLTRNLQCLLGHQVYTLCVTNNVVPSIGWLQIMSEWRHVRAILMQNKGLQVLLVWTPFLTFNVGGEGNFAVLKRLQFWGVWTFHRLTWLLGHLATRSKLHSKERQNS